MSRVGWIDSPSFDAHHHGPEHPERPERLSAIRERLAQKQIDRQLIQEGPPPQNQGILEAVHTPDYVNSVKSLCAQGGGSLDPDTQAVRESWRAACDAAGALTHAVDRVLSGNWDRAFCSPRPPGHHARPQRAMGFCLFNNIAVAAQAALDSGRVRRVAILDWDVHHGNGTQEIFWTRPDVLYASWHQFPFYPGTGAESEIGAAQGLGSTINCPLAQGSGDEAFLSCWERRIRPALEGFAPELLLISAGFDADARDPLGGLNLTPKGFGDLSERIVRWADRSCQGRVVSALEGGYDLEALADGVEAHLRTLL